MVIITDSAADLPKQVQKEFQLHVIPTPVVIDEKDYLDGETIFTKEFYDILEDSTRDVKTYHINPAMFENAFRLYAEKGESVLYICFSTGIAGTYNAANIAKESLLEEYPEFDLTIFDSRSASIGFGLIVYKLLCLQREGADKEELLAAADYYREHICHVFTVKTLAYLIKGGRLSKWKGTIGETLDMKPILIVNREGSLQVLNTVRGRKKSMKSLVDYVLAHGVDLQEQTLALCHGEDEEALSFIRKQVTENVQPKEELIGTVGCAIGAHTGRGIVGICFLDAPDWKKR